MLEGGTEAPAFALKGLVATSAGGEREIGAYRLSELVADGPVLLVFYPGDFSPVCTEQLCSLRDIELSSVDAGVDAYGVSRDSLFTHEAFSYEHGLDSRF